MGLLWSLLFGRGCLFGRALFLALPQLGRDGEGIHAHADGAGRQRTELLPVRAVLVNGLDGGAGDGPWAHAAQPLQVVRLAVQSVDGTKLAIGVAEQDQEVVGRAFLHLLGNGNEGGGGWKMRE